MSIQQRDIILIEVPYSDYSFKKVRPAIILSNEKIKDSKDVIAVPLTSNLDLNTFSFIITNNDLEKGNLLISSKVKVERIFSVEKKLVKKTIGKVKISIHNKIIKILNTLIE